MFLTALLSIFPRTLFEALFAVFLGTYIPKRLFQTTLPAALHTRYLSLPPPAVSSPVVLLLDPPPLASSFPTLCSTSSYQSSLLVLPIGDKLENIHAPIRDVETVFFSAVVLVIYVAILIATTFNASRGQSSRQTHSQNTVSQLYEFLTGEPYVSTHWERVLNVPDSAQGWYFCSPDIFSPDFPSDATQFSKLHLNTHTESSLGGRPRYAASLDADRLDAFAAHLLQFGYTDLRINAYDITPAHQPASSSAVTVDFRFAARSSARELITRMIMRFVMPCDVPQDRTDFVLWDLGEGWFRAFEVQSFEMAVLPVDEGRQRREWKDEHSVHLACIPNDMTAAEANGQLISIALNCKTLSGHVRIPQLGRIDPWMTQLVSQGAAQKPIGPWKRRGGHRRTTATVSDLDVSGSWAFLLSGDSDSSTWLLDAFVQGTRSNNIRHKLLTASAVPADSKTFEPCLVLPEHVPPVAPSEDVCMDGSWSEDLADSQVQDSDFLGLLGEEPEVNEFIIVPTGFAKRAVPAVYAAEAQQANTAMVVEETEFGVCSLPQLEDTMVVPDLKLHSEHVVATGPSGDVFAAQNHLVEGDFDFVGSSPPPSGPSDEKLPSLLPVVDDTSAILSGPAAEDSQMLIIDNPRSQQVCATLSGLVAPAAEVSMPIEASIGSLVDAALNSVISLPAPEDKMGRVTGVKLDLPAIGNEAPMLLKVPRQYLRVFASQEEADVGEPMPAFIGPLPPVQRV